ncbi:MAG TPA: hypothetical protein VGP72_24060 [Planctomycetota bacterium]|jgi:hypothetical protein
MPSVRLSNGTQIELLIKGSAFLGIGRVSVGGVALRSGRRQMFVSIRNPDGIELCDYQIVRREVTPKKIVLDLSMSQRAGGIMDWMVHSVRNRYNTADWTATAQPAKKTTLRLEIRPVTRKLGDEDAIGFSYQYRYKSARIPIYKILDRGTWEPGARAVGNEFWMRNCFVPPIVRIKSIAQYHSTEWYLPDCANPNIFQFLPLQTELQGFSFTAGKNGTLVTWATQVSHVRSLFEKQRGVDEIAHFHEHCGDLGLSLETAPVEVLWFAGKRDFAARANLYESVKELVHDTLHGQLGMRRERVEPYGMIEEWGNADVERYQRMGLPKLLDAGAKTIGVANHFENNMNTWGVSNMCCTVDYKVAETVGADKLRSFCQVAKGSGARVEMWGNTSVSTLTWLFDQRSGRPNRIRFLPVEGSIMEAFKKTKSPWVRNPSNALEADHYTPVFAVMNLRDPVVRDYWLKCWKHAHDDVGLGGIFLDSSFNLSSDKFHWVQNTDAERGGATADQVELLWKTRPASEPSRAILSQYRAHLDLMTKMQQLGYVYCNEDLGVFGVHRHGPGAEKRLGSLPLWSECLCSFDIPALEKAAADPADVFFRGLAYRMMWMLYWDIPSDRLSFCYNTVRGDYDLPTPWHFSLIKAFGQVNDLMHTRRILPKEAGVLYGRPGEAQVLWSFSDAQLGFEKPVRIQNVLDGSEQVSDVALAKKRQVLLVRANE